MEDLMRYVAVLYGGNATSGEQLQEANSWLVGFQQREEAAGMCINLLIQSLPSILPTGLLFYALQTILISIRRKKGKPTEKTSQPSLHVAKKEEELIELSCKYIEQYQSREYQTIRYKFMQVLSALWIRSEFTFREFMERLFTFCVGPGDIGQSPVAPSRVLLLLGCLELIPEEIDRSTYQITVRDELNSILRKNKERILHVCSFALDSPDILLRAKAIECLQSWNLWLINSRLILNHEVYPRVWNCLLIADLFHVTCTMLTDFLSRPFGSLSVQAGANVFALKDVYNNALRENNEEICNKISWMISAFANDNAHNIARDPAYCEQFTEFMLMVLSHPSHQIGQQGLAYFEKLAVFLGNGGREVSGNLFVNAIAHILRHLQEKPEEISDSSRQNILVFAFLDHAQFEKQADYYSEQLENYLEYYKQATSALQSISKLCGEFFYNVFFDAIEQDTSWLDGVLISCVAATDGQKEEMDSPALLRLSQLVLSGATSLSSSMIFIGTHSKWLRGKGDLLQSILHFVSAFPHASPLNELASFAKSFALYNLVTYHRYTIAENVQSATELIKHLQSKLCFIKGIHKLKWIESIALLITALPSEVVGLLSDCLNRPWAQLLENEDELSVELQMMKSVFRVLESADFRHQEAIRHLSVEFLRLFLQIMGNTQTITQHSSEISRLLCTLIDEVIFCTMESCFPILESLIHFLGSMFQATHFSCYLHSFSTCYRVFLRPETEESFCTLLVSITESVFNLLNTKGLSNHLEIVKEYFQIIAQLALKAEVLDKYLSDPGRLEVLVNLSVATLPYNEASSINVVFQFLQHLLERISNLSQLPHCQKIYQSVLRCIGNMFHQTVVQRSAALILFTFKQRIPPQLLQEWACSVVLEWKDGTRMTEEEINRLVRLLCTLESKFRFRAMIIDVSKICTGELMPDALLAYEF